jgi:hypothetical protein
MTGLQDLSISLASQRTATGFSSQLWEYSANGTSWSPIQTLTGGTATENITSSFKAFTLPTVSGLNNAAQAFVRITFTGASASGGNNRIDNVQFNASALVVGPTIAETSSLTPFSTLAGTASDSQSITVTGSNLTEAILASAPSDFEVSSDNLTFGDTATLSSSGGTAHVRIKAAATVGSPSGDVTFSSAGATSKTVAVSGTVIAAGTPTFELAGNSLNPFFSLLGQASNSQSLTMTAANFTDSVTVTPPSGFEISSNGVDFGSSALVIAPVEGAISQAIHARISASVPVGAVSGDLTLSGTNLSPSRTVALSGTVSLPSVTLALAPASLPEDSATPSVATVTIPFARTMDVTFSISSANTAAATVPASVLIPAGQLTATFDVTPVANPSSYGSNTSIITVSAVGLYSERSQTLTVTNVDVAPPSVISITSTTVPVTQNFDGLGTTTLGSAVSARIGEISNLGALTSSSMDGWYAAKIGGNGSVATPIAADIGSAVSGGVYSYGANGASDRALGVVASDSNTISIGALIKNDTGVALTGLKFSFTAEIWRSSTRNQNNLTFEYGRINGTTVTNTNFLSPTTTGGLFATMDITGPPPVATNGALDGNLTANQVAFTDVIVPVSLAAGETAFIRWKDFNETGSDAGLAIDNLSVSGVDTGLLAPEFSLAGGSYFADQNIKISNLATLGVGTEVRYTLDGNTPDASSSLYDDALGIDILDGNGSVTLKAITVSGSVSSSPATSVYVLPRNVASLTALRASTTGSQVYRVTGPITFTGKTNFRGTHFFQDTAAGIQVDDAGGIITTSYAVGDSVQNVVGTLAVFAGQLQFTPRLNFGTPVATGTVVTPLTRTLATLTDADQGMLVTVEEVSFESAGTFFTSGATTNIKDPSLTGFTGLFKNVFGDSDITATPMPSGTATITGVVQDTATGLTLAPRNLADIVSNLPPGLSFVVDKTTLVEGLDNTLAEAKVKIRRTGSVAETLVVNLTESESGALGVDTDELFTYGALPATVTFPIGSVEVIVYAIAKDNSTYLGNRAVTLTASATGMTSAEQIFSLTEDESAPVGGDFSAWAAINAGGQAADADYDGDGVANGVEYFFGATGSSITVNPGIVAGVITYPYDSSITGVTYRVLSSTNLTSWNDVTPQAVVGADSISYTLPSGSGKLFVRLEVVVAPTGN